MTTINQLTAGIANLTDNFARQDTGNLTRRVTGQSIVDLASANVQIDQSQVTDLVTDLAAKVETTGAVALGDIAIYGASGEQMKSSGTNIDINKDATGFRSVAVTQDASTALQLTTKQQMDAGLATKQDASAQLTSIATVGDGIIAHTALNTFTPRTITGTANRLDVSNGSGVSGNPTLDISTTYVGQATISTVGTVTSGTWNASTLASTYGGTGVSNPVIHTLPVAQGASAFNFVGPLTNGQVLIGSTGLDPVAASLTAGTNVTITPGAGSITINATGGGDVSGPASSTDNAIAVYNGTTGKIIKNSAVIVDASANITGVRKIEFFNSNLRLGDNTGDSITTGLENVFVGDFNGSIATSADGNTQVGFNNGSNLTTGDFNTQIGHLAGGQLTAGSFNTIIGAQAAEQSTTQNNITAVGYQAAQNSTTNNITAFGYQAAQNTDQPETAIGYQAGQNQLGGNNTFLGAGAGLGAVGATATFSIAIGDGALDNITSGGSNIAIGNDAGNTLTTGQLCTIIGRNAQSGSATASNRTVIGYQAVGSADNQVMLGDAGLLTIVKNSAATTDIGTTTNRFNNIYTNDVKIGASNYSVGCVKIQSQTAAASATIDFALPTGFARFEVIITGLKPVTDGAEIWARTSTDSGSTYDSGAGDYSYSLTTINDAAGTGVTADASATHITLQTAVGNAANEFSNFCINLYNPSAANYFHLSTEGTGTNITGVLRGITGMGVRKAAADVTNIRFMMDTGNISVGTFTLYGYFA